MDTALIQAVIFFVSFLLVWFGSGLVVNPISQLARTWKLPAFTVSFFLLGLITSLPEIAIGSISIVEGDPAIYAGNLLGGVIVMFLLIIPLLGLAGSGVRIPRQLGKVRLLFTLVTVLAPSVLLSDRTFTVWEGVFLIILYAALFLSFSWKESLLEKAQEAFMKPKKKTGLMFVKILVGVVILVLASDRIVDSTLYFSDLLKLSPFFVSLIVVSLGTNIPEISIVFRSIVSKKRDIALADYLGSASANTLLLGVFTLIRGETLLLPNDVLPRFFFLFIGLILFFLFARSRNTLSRGESFTLLGLYIAFIVYELLTVVD
jgi:cation:H+ antiporter